MRVTRKLCLGLSLVFFAQAPSVGAQEDTGCPADDTLIRTFKQDPIKAATTAKANESGAEAAKVALLPTSTGQDAGFCNRVNDSIEDFLPLVQFAVDSVSTADDCKSVTVKLNAIRHRRYGSLQFKATLTEPSAFQALLDEIPEEQRAAQESLIGDGLDDFSDITLSATYGYSSSPGDGSTLETVGRRWGRDPSTYSHLLQVLLTSYAEATAELNNATDAGQGLTQDERREITMIEEALFRSENPDENAKTFKEVNDLTLAEARAILEKLEAEGSLEPGRYCRYRELMAADSARTVRDIDELKTLKTLPFLIDNQPQFTVNVAFRDADELVGRRTWTATVDLEAGMSNNFNRLTNDYQARVAEVSSSGQRLDASTRRSLMKAALDNAALDDDKARKGQKFKLSATYVRHEEYVRDYSFGDPEQTVSLSLDQEDEFCGKVEWIRNATWHPIRLDDLEVYPRLLASLERVWTSDDSKRDRWIGNVTYNIPLQGGMSLPLSLVYANHGEFLGDPDHQLSAHFGVNFKLKSAGAG